MSSSTQEQMFDRIRQWQRSGLSQKAWCQKSKMAYSSFHYWYGRFRKHESLEPPKGKEGFVQLLPPSPMLDVPWCEIILDKGQKISFHHPVTADFIRNLLG
jgi:hypothetical protein